MAVLEVGVPLGVWGQVSQQNLFYILLEIGLLPVPQFKKRLVLVCILLKLHLIKN